MKIMASLITLIAILAIAANTDAQTIRYTSQTGQTPAAPYTSWATAASNIQDAVDSADDGDTIIVGDGVYDTGWKVHMELTNRVFIAKPVTVRSVNGPAATIIRGRAVDGLDAIRCVYLSDGAVLDGFSLVEGGTYSDIMAPQKAGGGAFVEQGGSVSNCWILDCVGSGVLLHTGGRITDSVIRGNRGIIGAGVCFASYGEVDRCIITGNTADAGGGGVIMTLGAMLRNSFISGNLVANGATGYGGGVAMIGGTIVNCTIVWNESRATSGGLDANTRSSCDIINTIVYHNTAPEYPDYLLNTEFAYMINSCATPLPPGAGNIDDEPMLIGLNNPHIAADSPCRGAGTDSFLYDGETDIDSEPRNWGGAVDIGCDQFVATNILGALDIVIDGLTNAVAGKPLRFRSAIAGKADIISWTADITGGTMGLTNIPDWTNTWPDPGAYKIVLAATNSEVSGAVTVTVTIAESFTNYFDPAGAHVAPFTNWANAATNLLDAVDECFAGGVVMVQTGTHALASEVMLDKDMTVRGAGSGPEDVVLDGGGANRCFGIYHTNAVIERLTVTGGSAETGGGVFVRGGAARRCVMTGNTATLKGGGAHLEQGGRLEDCVLTGNYAFKWGGGAHAQTGSEISRCTVLDNVSEHYGGGVYLYMGSEMNNSYIAGNESWGGGGVHMTRDSAMRHCTVVDNFAEEMGGGVRGLTVSVVNSIIYHNKASEPDSNNIHEEHPSSYPIDTTFSCTFPLKEGEGNIDDDPLMAGIRNPRLLAASPCRGVGDPGAVKAGDTDIFGNTRIVGDLTDIGCFQYVTGAATGAISVAIVGDAYTVAGEPEPLQADITGAVTGFVWRVALGGGEFDYATDLVEIAPVWSSAGDYEVVLWAGNDELSTAATVTVCVVAGGFTNYVSLDGAHVSPFASWENAATNIQAAIDACYQGGTVLVRTGRYTIASSLNLARDISLRSVDGPGDTIIDAQGACRVLNMETDGAQLIGFTITNGYSMGVGGIYMLGGLVSNCVVSGCEAITAGGGLEAHRNSVVSDSVIRGNKSWDWPGGLWLSGNASAFNCLVENNEARNTSGGILLFNGGLADGCTVQGNNAARGGGIFLDGGGTAINCMIMSNAASSGAGVFFHGGGFVSNCVVYLNWGTDGGGATFYRGGEMTDSLIVSNHACTVGGSGGGVTMSGGGLLRDCIVKNNEAAFGGGAWIQYDGEIRRCSIINNAARRYYENDKVGVGGGFYIFEGGLVADSLIADNTADLDAGGAVVDTAGEVIGCTITGNSAGRRCGGVYFVGSGGSVESSIVWGNEAGEDDNYSYTVAPAFTRSCVYPLPDGAGNIADDPIFIASDDRRLHWDSPCVDAGSPGSAERTSDLAGNQRAAGANEDMGCYELQARENMSEPDTVNRRGFRANWQPVTMATNYLLDVSASSNFSSFVPGYEKRSVELALSHSVTGLHYRVSYHCRVMAVSTYGTGVYSTVTNVFTSGAGGNDFGGSGGSALAVYDPSGGRWFIIGPDGNLIAFDVYWGGEGFKPVPGDYNGDGLADLAVYHEGAGLWFVTSIDGSFVLWGASWGGPGFAPVSGDFSGDGVSDLAVYHEESGQWFITSLDESFLLWGALWGGAGFAPVCGDFSGDGFDDLAVYHEESGQWFIMSQDGTVLLWGESWGGPGLVPVSGDFNGDGLADLAVYHVESGQWFITSLDGSFLLWGEEWGGAGCDPVGR